MMYVSTQSRGLCAVNFSRRSARGLGSETTQQAVGQAGSLVATGTAFIPGVGPIISAAVAAVTTIIEALLNTGCGQTCIVTSQWANQAAAALEQNVQAYMSLPAPRPYADQQAAEANFNNIWNKLVQLCSQSGLGTAGQNCIADRQRGACKWKVTSGPDAGQCFDWFMAYYDPIATDTNVASPITATQSAVSVGAALSSATGIPSSLLAIAALVLLVMVVKP